MAPPFTEIRTAEEAFTAAWEALGITAEELLAREALTDILKFHVIPGAKAMCTDLKAGEQKVGSLRGSELTVTFADGKITVKDATVTAADVDTSNGVIHIIDEGPPATFRLCRRCGHCSCGRKVRHTGCFIDKGRTGGCTER